MDARSELNLSEIYAILWKRRFVFFILFSIVFLTVLQVSFLVSPTYRASAKLLIQNEADLYPAGVIPRTADDKVFLSTQKELISSSFILNKALEDVKEKGLAEDIDYEKLKGKLFIDYLNNSNVLEVRVDHKNEEETKELANSISSAFIDYHVNAKIELIDRSLDILATETGSLKKDTEDLEARLKEFNDKEQIYFYQAQVPYFVDSILDIDKKNLSNEANIGRMQRELDKTDDALRGGDARSFYPLTPNIFGQSLGENLTSSLAANPWIQDLKIKLTGLETQLSNLLVEYTEEYPGTQGVRSQIALLKRSLDEEIKKVLTTYSDYYKGYIKFLRLQNRTSELEKDQYEAEMTRLSRDINNAAAKQIEFGTLVKTHDINQKIYAAFLQKEKELRILKEEISTAAVPNIRIFDYASLPLKKVSPNIPLNLFLGGFFGIFIGISGSLVLEKRETAKKKEKTSPEEFLVKEGRSMSRVGTGLSATYELVGDAAHVRHDIFTKDISGTGVRIKTDTRLSEGTCILLKIHIDDKDSIEATCEVIWVKTAEEKGMFEEGLHFIKIYSQEREKLINYLYGEHYLTQRV